MVTFSPAQVCVKIGGAGKTKCGLPPINMLMRAFLAGAYIAMGAAAATIGSTGVAPILGAGISQIVLGALFPIGLILVVLGGAELFTGDAMFAPMSVMQGQTTLGRLIYLWVLVYIGNLIGSVFLAFLVSFGPYVTWSGGAAAATAFGLRAIQIGSAKVAYTGAMGFLSCFFKGILCNWLVCLSLFLGLAADEVISKMAGIWFPIMVFVASGYEHCVANMYFIPSAIITNLITGGQEIANLNWIGMWTNNLIWSTLGNIVGAVIFVAGFYFFCFRKDIISSIAQQK